MELTHQPAPCATPCAQSKLRLRLRRAAFDHTRTLENFDFSFDPKLNKAQTFDLATCQFVEITGHSFRADHTKKQLAARRARTNN
jgi:hypothetical protein